MFKNKQLRFRKSEFQDRLAKARVYQRKSASSPILPSRRMRIVAACLLALIFYYLAISNRFLVREAEILDDGFSRADVNQVLGAMSGNRVALVIPSNHFLVFNQKRLLATLQKDFPEIRSVSRFHKAFPNRVELELEKRRALFVWQSGNEYFMIDQDGAVFQQFPGLPAGENEILIVDKNASPVQIGQKLNIGKALGFIQNIQDQWLRYIHETDITGFTLPSKQSSDILATTSTGFQIYFDLDRSVTIQLENLRLVLREQIRPETYSGLSYIDMRLATIAYYCYKDAPCALENATTTPQ